MRFARFTNIFVAYIYFFGVCLMESMYYRKNLRFCIFVKILARARVVASKSIALIFQRATRGPHRWKNDEKGSEENRTNFKYIVNLSPC